jgi:two-component system, OmpR family, phosphate regulon sensor histidine kinase PhoR
MKTSAEIHSLIEALDDPLLLVSGGRVAAANSAATAVLGRIVQGSDVRLAIRHPAALERILSGTRGDIEITGVGTAERRWFVAVRPLDRNSVLVRLVDRSAARAAEKMRVDFVANASHELRTPLTTIIGYADTIAEEGDLDEATLARFGGIIGSEAKRMLRIVQDLMSLSRIEADRFIAPQDEVSIGEVAELAATNARELGEQRTCQIELEVEPDLPLVQGDFAQLLQMTDNLVTNAIRYGCGSRGCTVRIAAQKDRSGVLLSVSDDGEGIAPEHLPRLTERFYRVNEARSRDSGGTGLGLAIVKHIVERHRGTLDIRSAPGRGTEVRVRLPRA